MFSDLVYVFVVHPRLYYCSRTFGKYTDTRRQARRRYIRKRKPGMITFNYPDARRNNCMCE